MADILDASKSNTPASPASPNRGEPAGGQPPSGTTPPSDATVPPAPPVTEPVPAEPVEPSPPPAGGLPATSSDSLIIPPPEAPTPPPPEEPKQEEMKPPEKPKKKSRLGVLLAGLLLLVITLPILVVFVRQQIEIRSRATGGVYPCDSTRNQYASVITSCLTVPTCDASTGVWTCPAGVAGKSCTTSGGWKGTCKLSTECNSIMVPGVVWDNDLSVGCGSSDFPYGRYGCCGTKPASPPGNSCFVYKNGTNVYGTCSNTHCGSDYYEYDGILGGAILGSSCSALNSTCCVPKTGTTTPTPATTLCSGGNTRVGTNASACLAGETYVGPSQMGGYVCCMPTTTPPSTYCTGANDIKMSSAYTCVTIYRGTFGESNGVGCCTLGHSPNNTPTCTKATMPTCPNNVTALCTGTTWYCPTPSNPVPTGWVCTTGARQCSGTVSQVCDSTGHWVSGGGLNCGPGITTTPPPGGYWYCGGGTGAPPVSGVSCTNGGNYTGTCVVYHCPQGCGGSTCGEDSPGVHWEFVSCASASLASGECGQIDTVNSDKAYCSVSSGCDVKDLNCSCAVKTPTPAPTPTPGGPTSTPTPTGSQMYYCRTDNHSCIGTTDLYTDVNTCATNVQLYGQKPNTDACWASQAACQSACQAGSQMFVCRTDTHSCIGTTNLYTDVNTCVANVQQYVTYPNTGACWTSQAACQSACQAGSQMFVCRTDTHSCIGTTNLYTDVNTCTANVQQYVTYPNSGVCYASSSECSTYCTSAPQCINIVAYKDGNALSASELAALQPGDTITLAFAPRGAATKVRFRVNAGSWNETTTKNANSQFIWNYTLANVTSFTIEAQWFDGSVWH